jgi:hypothetical protein
VCEYEGRDGRYIVKIRTANVTVAPPSRRSLEPQTSRLRDKQIAVDFNLCMGITLITFNQNEIDWRHAA